MGEAKGLEEEQPFFLLFLVPVVPSDPREIGVAEEAEQN
jgi:hypothetical protein